MESNSSWNFKGKEDAKKASACTIRSYLNTLNDNINKSDPRSVIPLSHGDPSGFPCFRTTKVSEDALVDAVQSGKYNGYPSNSVIDQATRSIAEYLSRDYSYELSPNDVQVTAGAKQAIDALITALAVPGANILLPRPGYPMYEALATFSHLEIRYYDLLPEQDWEVDICGLEAQADDRTVAMVIINPGNPCGNVYKHDHLKKIAEAARKLGMLVISDEAYGHLVFGSNSFVTMGVFGETVPILTIGSLSKRWMVPGWRVGWIVTCDRNGILQRHGVPSLSLSLSLSPSHSHPPPPQPPPTLKRKLKRNSNENKIRVRDKTTRIGFPVIFISYKPHIEDCLNQFAVLQSIKSYLDIGAVPSTLTLGAITRILDETPEDFYSNTINLLSKAADICYIGLREIPCFTPYKPQGSMFLMAKVNMSLLEGIDNDMEFCTKLAREESVVILPGEALGLKNWVRVTFAAEISALEDGLGRIKAFCLRYAKQQ